MDSNVVSYSLQYACIAIEAGLILYLARSGELKRGSGAALYLLSLLVAGWLRASILHKYGLTSRQYFYVYWSTDFLLVSSAFLVMCSFFRRACRGEDKLWGFVRFLLGFIFVLVVGFSALSISRNYSGLFPNFVYEFNQNLYFTCLVLNTLLYLLLQHIDSVDDQLGLLVCGVGIQFAGPAATLALVNLTAGERFAQSLGSSVMRLCTLGMLLVWAYAFIRVRDKETTGARHEVPALAEATAD